MPPAHPSQGGSVTITVSESLRETQEGTFASKPPRWVWDKRQRLFSEQILKAVREQKAHKVMGPQSSGKGPGGSWGFEDKLPGLGFTECRPQGGGGVRALSGHIS